MFPALRQRIRTLSHGFPPVGPWLFVLCVLVLAGGILVLSQTRQQNRSADAPNQIFQKNPVQFQELLNQQASSTPKIKEIQTILADRGLPLSLLWNVFHAESAALFVKEMGDTKDFSLVWQTKNPATPTEKLIFFSLSRLYPGIKKGLLQDGTLISTFTTAKTKVFVQNKDSLTTFTIPSNATKVLYFQESDGIYILSSTTTPIEGTLSNHVDQMMDPWSSSLTTLHFLAFPF